MEKGLIVLDPGHGKTGNEYPFKKGTYEGTQMFAFAQALREELEARGFSVMTTRPAIDDDPDLGERGSMAGANGARLFLSLHSNAPSSGLEPEVYKSIRGAEAYYSMTDEAGNAPLARALLDVVCEEMQTPDRGIHTRQYPDRPGVDYYGVIRSSAQSGCRRAILIEHGFHTNEQDVAFLTDPVRMRRMAAREAEVIDRFLAQEEKI